MSASDWLYELYKAVETQSKGACPPEDWVEVCVLHTFHNSDINPMHCPSLDSPPRPIHIPLHVYQMYWYPCITSDEVEKVKDTWEELLWKAQRVSSNIYLFHKYKYIVSGCFWRHCSFLGSITQRTEENRTFSAAAVGHTVFVAVGWCIWDWIKMKWRSMSPSATLWLIDVFLFLFYGTERENTIHQASIHTVRVS